MFSVVLLHLAIVVVVEFSLELVHDLLGKHFFILCVTCLPFVICNCQIVLLCECGQFRT